MDFFGYKIKTEYQKKQRDRNHKKERKKIELNMGILGIKLDLLSKR